MARKYFIFALMAIFCSFVITSCGDDNEEEQIDYTNWNKVNLNDEKSFIGNLFEAEKVLNEDGTDNYTPSQYKGYQINNDGTLTVYSGFAYKSTYPYTFSNGTFKYKRDTYGLVDDIELTFSHLNEYRLKLHVVETSHTGSVFEIDYKVSPREPFK